VDEDHSRSPLRGEPESFQTGVNRKGDFAYIPVGGNLYAV